MNPKRSLGNGVRNAVFKPSFFAAYVRPKALYMIIINKETFLINILIFENYEL